MLSRAIATATFLAGDPVRKSPTGQTPHSVVFRQGKASLRYFPPQGPARTRPLFVSMPLINTWTVFDLLPGRSVVEKLVAAGIPVYMLDWGRPGPEDASRTFADHADGVLPRMLRRAARHAREAGTLGEDELPDALGYCVGGTFLTVCLARNPGLARRLALLAAPIDFHASGRLSTWASAATFPVDDIIDGFGNYPAELMKGSFALLRPSNGAAKWKGLWDGMENPGFPELWAAMEQWNDDSVDFCGETYREYIRRCYFENATMAGGWVMAGRPVDLRAGTLPALVLAADKDHICPPAAAFGLAKVWGGPVETRTLKGGHVGVCIGKALPEALIAWMTA